MSEPLPPNAVTMSHDVDVGVAPYLVVENYIDGKFVPPSSGEYMELYCPKNGERMGRVSLGNSTDVDLAVQAARRAWPAWRDMPIKARCIIMTRLAGLYMQYETQLVELVMHENGKNQHEARGEVQKGNETVMYAAGLPAVVAGRCLEVSHSVYCEDRREPIGVVGSTAPFNFPFMVPMWTTPIALAMGNCVILKPSEKGCMCSQFHAKLMRLAGIPDGVFQVVNGLKEPVIAMNEHPGIDAITFVGSSPVAEIVYHSAINHNKRAICLGSAKNHLIAFPDASVDMTAEDIVRSFSGTSGQRCMAASVLDIVGHNPHLLELVVEYAKKLVPGQIATAGKPPVMGPMIDDAAVQRCKAYIEQAEAEGAKILVDGRTWIGTRPGNWFGPTIIYFPGEADPAKHAAYTDEIFGPVLTVVETPDREAAIALQNGTAQGNAACVYTASGETAEWVVRRLSSGMIGVNIGVPVPREPFSFGGRKISKFGIADISDDGAVEFFSQRKKITTKWVPPEVRTWMD